MILYAGKGQLSLKGTAEAAFIKVGRDANVGVAVSDKGDAAPIMSYSCMRFIEHINQNDICVRVCQLYTVGVKGLYAGITLDLNCLMPRNECNANYYGRKVKLEQITKGEITMKNAEYERILFLLNSSISHRLSINDLDNDAMNSTYCPPLLPQVDEVENDEKEGNYSIFESN